MLADTTLKQYQYSLNEFQAFLSSRLGSDPDLADITRDHIRAFRSYLLERKRKRPGRRYPPSEETPETKRRRQAGKLSRTTVHVSIRTIKRLFNFLSANGKIKPSQSPVLGVKNVTLPSPAPKAIATEHCRKMIMVAARSPLLLLYQLRNKAIVSLMGATGQDGREVGSGELSRLKLADTDGDRLHLEHKSKERFTLTMTAPQQQALGLWLNHRPQDIDSPYVFITLDNRGGEGEGGQMQTRAVYSTYFYQKNRTAEDLERIQQLIARDEHYAVRRLAFILFLADSGARFSGVLGLTHNRLDLESRQAIVIEKGKIRPVFFCPATKEALEAWLAISEGQYQTVFGFTAQGMRRLIDRLAEQAGVDAIHNPHSFRHAFAKITLWRGADLATVSQLMGHSTVKITADYYARFSTRELARAHDRFSPVDGLLEGLSSR